MPYAVLLRLQSLRGFTRYLAILRLRYVRFGSRLMVVCLRSSSSMSSGTRAFRGDFEHRKQKADVVEHPEEFDHVGLLFNKPPGKARLLFV